MNRRRMSFLDSTFLRIETSETPMHVGALMVFELPEGAGDDFVANVVAKLREGDTLRRPFNQILARGAAGKLTPAWETAGEVDMTYHVRHSALPAPRGERELGELVSHVHSARLDRSRPMWTCHVIEGLEGNRFAIYVKIHHALADGVSGIRLGTEHFSTTPDGEWLAPWQTNPDPPERRPRRAKGGRTMPRHQAVASLAGGLAKLRRSGDHGERVRLPFQAPASPLNLPVTNARRVATQQLAVERIRSVAKRTGTSMNDVFLALCGDSLRDYLRDIDALPQASLIAGVPVSLREEGDEGANSVGFLWATLGTDLSSPIGRLTAVNRSMLAAKSHLKSMAASVRPTFTLMTMALPSVVMLSGHAARMPKPPMNVTISNVPGPAEVRYVAGAPMVACYPISVVFQGMGLNITCITYAGQFNVGVVGSRDTLPSLQRIAVDLGSALDRLEVEAGA